MPVIIREDGDCYVQFFPTEDTSASGARYVQEHRAVRVMREQGSGFSGPLAEAWGAADGRNVGRLRHAFPDVLADYADRVPRMYWLTHDEVFYRTPQATATIYATPGSAQPAFKPR